MKKINYLILTDIHFNLNFLNFLVSKNIQNIDGILILGDLVNANHEEPLTDSAKDEKEFEEVLNLAKSIHPKVFYIPGNHDPSKYFQDNVEDSEHCPINLHKRLYRIDDNLVIAGLGGSVNSYLKNFEENLVWKGYPYELEEEYDKDLKNLFSPVLNVNNDQSLLREGDSILLLTHTGPSNIDTTQIKNCPSNSYNTEIASGSHSLYNFLSSSKIQTLAFPSNPLRPTKRYPILTANEERINYHLIANLHGHSHAGWGMVGNLGGHLPVINPGSLQDGKFCKLELSEVNPIPDSSNDHPRLLNKIWTVTSTEFLTIW